MELDQVVFEYGRLQLNFVACQRQATMLATQLAQTNKNVATLNEDKGKALARVTQLETYLTTLGKEIPPVPKDAEPAKEPTPQAPGPALVPPAKPSTEN